MAIPDPTLAGLPESLRVLVEEIFLDLPAVEQALGEAVQAAAAGIGLSCGITYVARYGVLTVASSDERANAVDEMQYGTGDGPCLEALRTRTVVRVTDLETETRWGSYRDLAIQAGVRSSLSLPLIVDNDAVGALNVYSTQVGPLPADLEAAALLASRQVTGILHAVRHLAAGLLRHPRAARDLQARHELDIATGILMSERGCSGPEARTILFEQASTQGIPVQHLATRMLAGHPPRPTP